MTGTRPPVLRAVRPAATTAVAVLVLLISVWIGSASLSTLRAGVDGPVYTVAQLHNYLARSRSRVVGQTIRVRGVLHSSAIGPCSFILGACDSVEIRLTGPDGIVPGMEVLLEPERPLAAWLRRLPWISTIIPPAQELRWDAPAIYRVQVRRVPGSPADFAVVIPDTAS